MAWLEPQTEQVRGTWSTKKLAAIDSDFGAEAVVMGGNQNLAELGVYLGPIRIARHDLVAVSLETDIDRPGMAIVIVQSSNYIRDMARIGESLEIRRQIPSGVPGPVAFETIFKGEIVGIEPLFKAGGQNHIELRAFDRLHRLIRGKRH